VGERGSPGSQRRIEVPSHLKPRKKRREPSSERKRTYHSGDHAGAGTVKKRKKVKDPNWGEEKSRSRGKRRRDTEG